jgi:histidine ammonia-lyase
VLDELESAAVLAVRLVSLASGHPGVREVLLERVCDLLNDRARRGSRGVGQTAAGGGS